MVRLFSGSRNPEKEPHLLLSMGMGDAEAFRTVWRLEQCLILSGSRTMSPWLSSSEPSHYTEGAMPTEFGLVNYLERPARLNQQNLCLNLTACWSSMRTYLAL